MDWLPPSAPCDHHPTLIEVSDYFRSLTCPAKLHVWDIHPMKTYLCSTITQLRFNTLLLLLVHKERTDTLQLTACLNEFVSGSENRSSLFGTFWVIFSSMFHCLTCISLWNEIGVWEATRSCLSLSNFQIFFWGSMPPRLWHAKQDRFVFFCFLRRCVGLQTSLPSKRTCFHWPQPFAVYLTKCSKARSVGHLISQWLPASEAVLF